MASIHPLLPNTSTRDDMTGYDPVALEFGWDWRDAAVITSWPARVVAHDEPCMVDASSDGIVGPDT